MASSKNGKKVVRTESILDEAKIYFSHILSPFKKKKEHQQQQMQTYNHYDYNYSVTRNQPADNCDNGDYKQEDDEYENEDVDERAEGFIKKKHQKFRLSKWFSFRS